MSVHQECAPVVLDPAEVEALLRRVARRFDARYPSMTEGEKRRVVVALGAMDKHLPFTGGTERDLDEQLDRAVALATDAWSASVADIAAAVTREFRQRHPELLPELEAGMIAAGKVVPLGPHEELGGYLERLLSYAVQAQACSRLVESELHGQAHAASERVES